MPDFKVGDRVQLTKQRISKLEHYTQHPGTIIDIEDNGTFCVVQWERDLRDYCTNRLVSGWFKGSLEHIAPAVGYSSPDKELPTTFCSRKIPEFNMKPTALFTFLHKFSEICIDDLPMDTLLPIVLRIENNTLDINKEIRCEYCNQLLDSTISTPEAIFNNQGVIFCEDCAIKANHGSLDNINPGEWDLAL